MGVITLLAANTMNPPQEAMSSVVNVVFMFPLPLLWEVVPCSHRARDIR